MKPLTAAQRAVFTENAAVQNVYLRLTPKDGSLSFVPPTKIKKDTLTIDDTSVCGQYIELGNVIVPDLRVTLINDDGTFDGLQLEGGTLDVVVFGGPVEDSVLVDLGRFRIDSAVFDSKTVVIKALGVLVDLDIPYNTDDLTFPMTLAGIVDEIGTKFGYDVYRADPNLVNTTFVVQSEPKKEGLTWRQLLGYCCELMGCCAVLEYDFTETEYRIELKWYQQTGLTVDASLRFDGQINPQATALSDLYVISADGRSIVMPSAETGVITVKNNPLLTSDVGTGILAVYSALKNKLSGFTAHAFSATILPAPYLEPFDMLIYEDADGNEFPVAVTGTQYKIHENAKLCGKSISETKFTVEDYGAFTPDQKTALGQYAKNDDLAQVARTGAYGDLTGKPTLSTVATSGAYSDLSGKPDLTSYMQKFNPAGNGHFSIGRKENTTIGLASVAIGQINTASAEASFASGSQTEATGYAAHAEGNATVASGRVSHAEGGGTEASGQYSHAEGFESVASGYYSHAEGIGTEASGPVSHAEGSLCKAIGGGQHVQGRLNLEDNANRYAHIVGNGYLDDNDEEVRSNAHTLDWDGNAWYSGEIRSGGADYDHGARVLTTEDFNPIDTVLGYRYQMGIENGLLYIEEVV